MYNFVVWFTGFYEKNSNSSYSSFLLLLFLVGSNIGSLLCRTCGIFVDKIATNIPSLNILTGIFADCFIIIFERNLFSFITSWENFLIFAALSSLFDLSVCCFQLFIFFIIHIIYILFFRFIHSQFQSIMKIGMIQP
jgi:hypothetical protein